MFRAFIILFLFSISAFSQVGGYNRLSLELAGGFNIPSAPKTGIKVSDYLLPRHIDLGMRYMFSKYLGTKFSYSFDRFQKKVNKTVGNSYHRLSLELVYNVTNRYDLFNNKWNLLAHGGVGITHAYPEAIKRYAKGGRFTYGLTPNLPEKHERIGNLLLGFTIQYKYNKKWAFFLDGTSVYNIEQQYTYSGELLNSNSEKVKGRFFNFSLGVQYYLGRNRNHADWVRNKW